MKLSKVQKNQLFETIEELGLQPANFELSELSVKDKIQTKVLLTGSNYYFLFDSGATSCSPGFNAEILFDYHTSWKKQTLCFHQWLQRLHKETNAEDKWLRIGQLMKSHKLKTVSNQKFNAGEYEEVKFKLEILRQKINEIHLGTAQQDEFNARIEHLTDLASALNKQDWNFLFLGAILHFQTTLNLEQATEFLEITAEVFTNIF